MKNLLKLLSPIGAILLISVAVSAQGSSTSDNSGSSVAGAVAKGAGKAAVIVVGSAAEAGWVVTKFTAKQVAKPVAKTIFLKAVPKLTVFALRNSSTFVRKLAPQALKIALL
jgi:hypothetical protein